MEKHQRELFGLEKKESKPKDCKPIKKKEENWAIDSERKRGSGELIEMKWRSIFL